MSGEKENLKVQRLLTNAAYEKELLSEGIYLAPQYVADTLASLFTTNRESVKVLDVAAGSGLMGEKLYTHGFRKIDGLDPSQGMLDICSRKNVYLRLICDFMRENPTKSIQKGGYICIIMREEFLDLTDGYKDNQLEDNMRQLETEGLWTIIERRVAENNFCNKSGVIFVFNVK